MGEASVIVAASAEHRQEAIEAVAFVIDAVKSTAAIWKKVTYYSIACWGHEDVHTWQATVASIPSPPHP